VLAWQALAPLDLAPLGVSTHLGFSPNAAVAQSDGPSTDLESGLDGSSNFGQSGDVFGGINFGAINDGQREPVTWNAKYFSSGSKGRLEIECTLGRSWHIYSTTQPSGGPLPTKFEITAPKGVTAAGTFQPDRPPQRSVSETYGGITVEEFGDQVTWSTNLNLPGDFEGSIEVKIRSLVCQDGGSCVPSNETLTASRAGPLDASGDDSPNTAGQSAAKQTSEDQLAEFRESDYEVTWKAGVSSAVAPGGKGRLRFTAKPAAEYHVYHAAVDDRESSTNFVITEKSGLRIGAPETDSPVISSSVVPGLPAVKFHEGDVTWELPIQVPEGTAAGAYKIGGFVGYQACTDSSCLQPQALQFTATVTVADQSADNLQPIELKTAKYTAVVDTAATTKWVDDLETTAAPAEAPDPEDSTTDDSESDDGGESDSGAQVASDGEDTDSTATTAATDNLGSGDDADSKASLPLILLMAFGGGLILNLMPCVLPVVGLKIMSFVQQAGEDRGRIFALNFAYVAGILAVFAGLTLLAVFASFGWGQQFTYFPVRLGLTVLIFALALSYLGVWELPTPGIATGDASHDLQEREGFAGAFFKGAFATILATPCSGPLLGVVLGYTITLQPIETATVMMTVGLGMSSPYIFLGLFPGAIGFLPKPGNWMVTLKEFLAFLFLGTVAFFFNQFSDADKLPVFVTLIGVWFGCWVIGKVPPWESVEKRLRSWTVGVAAAVAIGWMSFAYLGETQQPASDLEVTGVEYIVDNHLRWEKYSEERLQELQASGKTVMLDFTAAWCVNCIVNKKVALDTEATSELLRELDGVAMLADYTDQNEEIASKLKELNSRSIPLLAIYPGSNPDDPIVLRDLVSQSTVLKALKQAGASEPGKGVARSKGSTAKRLTSARTSGSASIEH
jgi:thiol:disulfide interchange protein